MLTSADAVISFDIMGGVNKRIPKFFQVFVQFVPVHQISGKSLHIVQMSDQKWARKIVQLNIIQINAQPLEFCMWNDSLQIFIIYQK